MRILFLLVAVRATLDQQEMSSDPRIIGGSKAIRKGKNETSQSQNLTGRRVELCGKHGAQVNRLEVYLGFNMTIFLEIDNKRKIDLQFN